MSIYQKAVECLSNHFTANELLQLHEEIDGDPNDGFFGELTLKVAELFPEEFDNQDYVIPIES